MESEMRPQGIVLVLRWLVSWRDWVDSLIRAVILVGLIATWGVTKVVFGDSVFSWQWSVDDDEPRKR